MHHFQYRTISDPFRYDIIYFNFLTIFHKVKGGGSFDSIEKCSHMRTCSRNWPRYCRPCTLFGISYALPPVFHLRTTLYASCCQFSFSFVFSLGLLPPPVCRNINFSNKLFLWIPLSIHTSHSSFRTRKSTPPLMNRRIISSSPVSVS